MSTTAQELKNTLANHYGSETWYKHPFTKMTYTEGVKAFAETAGAYWLLDKIALEIYHPFAGKVPFMTITLHVKNSKAILAMDDGDNPNAYWKGIHFTDCPDGEWIFFLQNDVLMLPTEY